MRALLWADGSKEEHAEEIAQFFRGEFPRSPWAVLVAGGSGALVGFAEVALRPYAEGCTTTPVGYLEGWYVSPDYRRTGVGRALLAAAEGWARDAGCREFASDADPGNTGSVAAHEALGFEDAGMIRCYRKSLQ